MAKIFLSFMNCMRCGNDTSAMPCYYESFLKGLKNAGNEILVFSDWGIPYGDRPSSTARIKKSITAFQPDLIIAFNNYGPDFSSMCDCPIVILEVDSPLYYDGKALIKRHPDRYLYCVVQEESRRVLMSDFGVVDSRISFLPFFSEVRAERKEKVYNISFLGSRFAGREFHWHHFRRKHNDMRDIEEYKRLIDEIRAHPLAPAAEEISELCRQAIDQRYRFSNVLSTLEQVTGMTLRTTSREGSVAFVSYANYPARRGHRLSCALQCLKLAITQIPGCERLFTQKNCVKRIVKYTDYW